MTVETTEETGTEPAPNAKPADPRRAADVVLALKLAARRDPHPDPFKGLGRASFIIWIAIVATLGLVGENIRKFVDVPKLETQATTVYRGFAGSARERAHAAKEISRNQHKMEFAAVAGFAGGTLIFAIYYGVVYLLGMNTRRLLADATIAVRAGTQRVRGVARRVRAWNKKRKASDATIVEDTPAGPEPHLG